jgi:DNA-binding NtrC family response regulator
MLDFQEKNTAEEVAAALVVISRMIRLALYSTDPKLQPLLAPALGEDFYVIVEGDPDRLKETLSSGSVDVLLLDLDSNPQALKSQRDLYNEINSIGVATVALADDDSRSLAIELVQNGAHSYCRKPPAIRELKVMVKRAYEYAVMKRELERRQSCNAAGIDDSPACDKLIGRSAEMRNVYSLVHRVADLNASVLITGESGTGKELIARAIHNCSNRSKAPFIAVSCGAIPATLIESELFGHEKGAFTGSHGTRTGYFEEAGAGTLFLDEIGELSLQTQVKLLRVLQQREFTRLGSGRAIPLKARVVFATHKDLQSMVAAGTFRLDLFYRINVMSIKSPALADRPEDIPLLANHFLRQYAEMYDKRMEGFHPTALSLLETYEWPGNVRELENVIQTGIICADGDVILPKDLPEQFQGRPVADVGNVDQLGSFERQLRDFKLKLALRAIEECQGNKTLAARNLNISRAYLHRLIRQPDGAESVDEVCA